MDDFGCPIVCRSKVTHGDGTSDVQLELRAKSKGGPSASLSLSRVSDALLGALGPGLEYKLVLTLVGSESEEEPSEE